MNKAYKILMSPIQRAEYLLQINNMDVVESNTISDKAFLMKMMERNEQVRIILNFNQFSTLSQQAQVSPTRFSTLSQESLLRRFDFRPVP